LGQTSESLATAEEALRRTTAEFIYQQLAVEGDALANLELARNLGILDEASYNAALVAQELKKQYEGGAISAENYGKMAGLAADAIARLQSRDITITYTSVYQEIHRGVIQDATMAAGGQGGGVSDGVYAPHAEGGPTYAGQPYLVGERGPELIVPSQSGFMLNAEQTAQALAGNGGHTFNIAITVPGGDAPAISRAIAGELRRALRSGVSGVAQ
jgi:hypothetical protein